ncbi:hypothetical protein RRG08_023508 [Elysia crispata]|uniref:Uncharacterized protein n=1 Tax=Elysia crispata TaxID=231223 RepID=A0AAE1D7A6_9GAST|nr:hypothetical protein RRG08_023508 [Elysia crispata]
MTIENFLSRKELLVDLELNQLARNKTNPWLKAVEVVVGPYPAAPPHAAPDLGAEWERGGRPDRYLRGLSVSDACSECQASRGQSSPCDRREGPTKGGEGQHRVPSEMIDDFFPPQSVKEWLREISRALQN